MAAEGAGAAEAEAERCRGMVDTALARAPVVKFLLEQLEAAGCGVGPAFFAVERCSNAVGGGFRPPDGVVVCSNHLKTQTEIDNVLAHELIHAFDHCRAKDLDWGSCVHHACSEVRAANLSGDCHMKQEWLRGNLGVLKQHQACVKRRAELSVAMNPLCAGAAARSDSGARDARPLVAVRHAGRGRRRRVRRGRKGRHRQRSFHLHGLDRRTLPRQT